MAGHWKKYKTRSFLEPNAKINSKWIRVLDVFLKKVKPYIFLEENINEFFINWEWGKLPNSDSNYKLTHCRTDN